MRWKEIVDQHGEAVWRTVYRLLGNEADAADCYQDVFAAALVIGRREEIRNWGALLQKVAMVLGVNRLRKRSRERARMAVLEEVISQETGPVGAARERELVEWLRGALVDLGDDQAQAFWLTAVEGLRYDEAAERMGIEAGHVGVLVHRARAKLREMLSPLVQ